MSGDRWPMVLPDPQDAEDCHCETCGSYCVTDEDPTICHDCLEADRYLHGECIECGRVSDSAGERCHECQVQHNVGAAEIVADAWRDNFMGVL